MSDTTSIDRRDDSAISFLITEVHKDVRELRRELDDKLSKHTREEAQKLAEAVTKVMMESFPEGDAILHRKRHEAEIAMLEARTDFWAKMRYEVTRWGLLGVLGWTAIVAWKAFVKGPL